MPEGTPPSYSNVRESVERAAVKAGIPKPQIAKLTRMVARELALVLDTELGLILSQGLTPDEYGGRLF